MAPFGTVASKSSIWVGEEATNRGNCSCSTLYPSLPILIVAFQRARAAPRRIVALHPSSTRSPGARVDAHSPPVDCFSSLSQLIGHLSVEARGCTHYLKGAPIIYRPKSGVREAVASSFAPTKDIDIADIVERPGLAPPIVPPTGILPPCA